ncbi:histidine phosphatase family protein [Chelativorans sp. SCAU2101]|uniref:Histidine phosphatase family protein n=1 Tax=Chelativorans petroleitrophicus TaxID=2975484 RepID=A0A9X3B086_9HYPH|nr:histidine phosphatase family protein [Chelativorans petroleitrophicus]MCT8991415.1 histidine phosphatase family protein [Chelativorans petroleitrophicus]
MFPQLYIIRHGETDWNVEERLQGQADTDINERGRAQADRNGRRLAELISDPSAFDFVASPLRRTAETMERVRVQLGLPPHGYRTDPRLKEVHFGDWQGFTYAELEAREPGCTDARSAAKWHFLPPGADAESYEVLAARVRSWLEELKRPTVCVTHGGVVRTIFHWLGGLPAEEACELAVPQDRILRAECGRLEWV